MPEKVSNIKFTGHHKPFKATFLIYADIGTILKKVYKIDKNRILTNHILINMKSILLVVMDTKLGLLSLHR